jgi:hypothetical protein
LLSKYLRKSKVKGFQCTKLWGTFRQQFATIVHRGFKLQDPAAFFLSQYHRLQPQQITGMVNVKKTNHQHPPNKLPSILDQQELEI